MNEKFELIGAGVSQSNGKILYQLRAKRDIRVVRNDLPYKTLHPWEPIDILVKAGDLGGLVEREDNLSSLGSSWIFPRAMVCDNAKVRDDAVVFGRSVLCDSSSASANALLGVPEDSLPYLPNKDFSHISLHGNAEVSDDARLRGNVWMEEGAYVAGHAVVDSRRGFVNLEGQSRLYRHAQVYGNVTLRDRAMIDYDGIVESGYGREIELRSRTHLSKGARVFQQADFLSINGIGSRHDCLTAYRSDRDVMITTGCFCGTTKEFLAAAKQEHDCPERRLYLEQYRTTVPYVTKMLQKSAAFAPKRD